MCKLKCLVELLNLKEKYIIYHKKNSFIYYLCKIIKKNRVVKPFFQSHELKLKKKKIEWLKRKNYK